MAFNDRGSSFRGRDSNRGGFGGPKEMHNAKCSDCGAENFRCLSCLIPTDQFIAEIVFLTTGNPEKTAINT